MKTRSWMRMVGVVALVFVAGAATSSAGPPAFAYLADENTDQLLVDFTPHHGNAVMSAWTVDGAFLLNRIDYFYRIGDLGPEAPLDTVGSLDDYGFFDTDFDLDLDLGFARFAEPGVAEVELTISLLGGAPGSGTSDVTHQLKVTNTGDETLDFHLFQYVDFDLLWDLSTLWDNGIVLVDPVSGLPIKVIQTGGAWAVSEIVTPDAGRGELGLIEDGYPSIYDRLTDGDPTTLGDVYGPVGPGDVEYALQWDVEIPVGGSFILSKDILITPEPSTILLGLVGILGLSLTRRRRG